MNKEREEKRRKILIIIGWIIVGFLLGLIFSDISIKLVKADTSQDQLQLVKQLALQNAQEHKWVWGKFQCGDFTGQLSIKLWDNHIKMNMKAGKWFNNGDGTCSYYNQRHFKCKHYWLSVILENKTEINIETTTGNIIPSEEYKRNYK
jgi:hypothetical protein